MPGGFVGRRAELDGLRNCVAKAADGHPQLVLVDGPAGVGKTSLLAEFAATLTGWRQLTASGDEAEIRLAYGLLARVMSGAQRGWSAGTHAAGPDGADPFTVGAGLLQLLGDLQASGPIALIIDDAPWSDAPSLRATQDLTGTSGGLHPTISPPWAFRSCGVAPSPIKTAWAGSRFR